MKNCFLTLLISLVFFQAICQVLDCKDENSTFIKTNPNAPFAPGSSSASWKLNSFDWTQPNLPYIKHDQCGNPNVPGTLRNPFFDIQLNGDERKINFGTNSDFYPESGWELIKRDFGYYMDPLQMDPFPPTSINNTGVTTNSAYLVLYNRYTATLRIFSTLPFDLLANNVKVSLWFDEPNSQNGYEFSNLMSSGNNMANPLDQKSKVVKLDAFAGGSPGNCNRFFYVDFPMAYDPCTCHNKAKLNVSFEAVTEMDFEATGASIGIAQDIVEYQNSKSANYNFTEDYFQGAYDPNGVTGLLTMNKIDRVYTDYLKKFQTKGKNEIAAGFKFLATAAKYGKKVAELDKDNLKEEIELLSTSGNALEIATDVAVMYKSMKTDKALSMVGAVYDFLSGKQEETKPTPHPAFVMESELKLKGRISTNSTLSSSKFQFGLPGSKDSETYPQCCDLGAPGIEPKPDRATYNEALGLFALKKTPTVFVSYQFEPLCTNSSEWPIGSGQQACFNYISKDVQRLFSLNEPIEYFLNPAAEINYSKTKVKAALVLAVQMPESQVQFAEIEGFTFSIYDNQTGTATFITPFVAPNCMGSFTPYIKVRNGGHIGGPSGSNPALPYKLSLRFNINYVFKELNRDGKENTSYQILTYPVHINEVRHPLNIDFRYSYYGGFRKGFPDYLNLTESNFTKDTTIYAWDGITISGNLSTQPEVRVSIVAPNIEVFSGFNVSPEIELVSGNPPSCSPLSYMPPSLASVNTFCNSTDYKANQSNTRLAVASTTQKVNYSKTSSTTLGYPIPNPTTGKSTIALSLGEDGPLEAYLSNSIGVQVKSLLSKNFAAAGKHSIDIDTQDLEAGVYFITVKNPGFSQARKLVVVK